MHPKPFGATGHRAFPADAIRDELRQARADGDAARERHLYGVLDDEFVRLSYRRVVDPVIVRLRRALRSSS